MFVLRGAATRHTDCLERDNRNQACYWRVGFWLES